MGCGCSRNSNKIHKDKKGNRKKKQQECDSCGFIFMSSTQFKCCPKCSEDMKKKNTKKDGEKSFFGT